MAKVAIDKDGPVTVVSIDRFGEARNAVDPETALLLREAFLAFDADEIGHVRHESGLPFRRVDDALPAHLVVGVHERAQIGERVLHLATVVELRATEDAIRHA